MILLWILAAWVGLNIVFVAVWCGMKWIAGLGREPRADKPVTYRGADRAPERSDTFAPSRPDGFEWGHRIRGVK